MADSATPNHSRRGFLKSASTTAAVAGVGIAGAGMFTANDAAAKTAAKQVAAPEQVSAPKQATEPLVAYVRDAHSGEIAVMVGDRQVVVHDKDLAARIARVAY